MPRRDSPARHAAFYSRFTGVLPTAVQMAPAAAPAMAMMMPPPHLRDSAGLGHADARQRGDRRGLCTSRNSGEQRGRHGHSKQSTCHRRSPSGANQCQHITREHDGSSATKKNNYNEQTVRLLGHCKIRIMNKQSCCIATMRQTTAKTNCPALSRPRAGRAA